MKSKLFFIACSFLFSFSSYSQQIGSGFSSTIPNFNIDLPSGFYGGSNPTGINPDGSYSGWQHLLNLRHENPGNNHQLQISSSYAENDRMFFRKFARGLGEANPTWHEIATRGSNTFVGNQVINGGHGNTTLFLHAQNASDEQHADLSLWASEPGLTWQGVGIGNNIHNFKNGEFKLSLLNPARGGSYMRLLNNQIRMNVVSQPGDDRNVVVVSPDYFQSNQNIAVKTTPAGSLSTGAAIAIGDSDTGIKQQSEGELAVFNNNVETVRFKSNGYVGIGTPDPKAKLHINNGDNSYGVILASANESSFSLYAKSLITQPTYVESFRLGLKYDTDENNGFISFYRGGSTNGGYLGFSTNGAERIRINADGYVGIGSLSPDEKLTVKGKIHAEEIRVDLLVPADYVFQKYYTGKSDLKPTYTMPTLAEVAQYTKAHNHLPNIPSAQEIKDNGLELGKMNNLLLQKIEELTLYLIEQNKKIELLEGKIELLNAKK